MDRFAELKAFALVASSGGFSSAARELGVATSSVTRLVNGLEQRLGAPLLNRSTRGVTLTDSGRDYHDRAAQILAALDEADDAASGAADVPHGMLRVAAPVTFATMYIAPLLPELAHRYPRLVLDLRLSDSLTNMVDEAIDVAIRIGNMDRQPALIARKLATHRRSICASAAYLERHGAPRTPSELRAHNCLCFAYGTGRNVWRLQTGTTVEEIEVSGTVNVNNSEMLRRAVIDGTGLALLPEWLVKHDIDGGLMVRVLEQYEANPGDMDIGIYTVYAANRRGASKIKVFADMLAEAMQRACPD